MAFLTTWTAFFTALILFVASHSIPAHPLIRSFLINRIGRLAYISIYSTISLILFTALIFITTSLPFVPIWELGDLVRWVPILLLPFSCLLTTYALGSPNPFSFGGSRTKDFDPKIPGIVGLTRHPFLWAIGLWSLSHLLVNGDLSHIILFGAFGIFAFWGMPLLDLKAQRTLGKEEWAALLENVKTAPLASLFMKNKAFPLNGGPIMRFIFALLLFALLLVIHEPLLGVSPFPN